MTAPTGSRQTALLVHCHSEADSFVTAMRDTIARGLAARNYDVTHSDLYAMGFNPVLSPADFGSRRNPDHLVYALEQRHGFETSTLAPDILAEVEKVQAASLVVFTFPLFWYSVPALLKGWIDRVFLSGAFYGGRRIYDQGGMVGKRAFAAFSLGGSEALFGPDGIHGPLTEGMMRHFFQGTLGYCGFSVLEPFVAWHVPYLDEGARSGMLDRLRTDIDGLEGRKTLLMPAASLIA